MVNVCAGRYTLWSIVMNFVQKIWDILQYTAIWIAFVKLVLLGFFYQKMTLLYLSNPKKTFLHTKNLWMLVFG